MPTYEYKCPSCGNVESRFRKINENSPIVCLDCYSSYKLVYMQRGPGEEYQCILRDQDFTKRIIRASNDK